MDHDIGSLEIVDGLHVLRRSICCLISELGMPSLCIEYYRFGGLIPCTLFVLGLTARRPTALVFGVTAVRIEGCSLPSEHTRFERFLMPRGSRVSRTVTFGVRFCP